MKIFEYFKFLFWGRNKSVHYTAEDIYFLRISDECQKDTVHLMTVLYNLNFTRTKCTHQNRCVYSYEKEIKAWPWQNPSYNLKIRVFKSTRGLFVPAIFVKDLRTLKDYDPLIVPWHDRVVVQNELDKAVQMLIDSGVAVIPENGGYIKFTEREE